MQLGVEHVDVLRAAIADMFGKLDRKHWERSASAFCQNVWVTDCNSTSISLLRPVMGKVTDRRLAIEVAAMRRSLWQWPGQELGDDNVEDERPPEGQAADVVRWVDTDVMLVDPMTKAMSSEKPFEALDNNFWDMQQPIESLLKKRAKQAQRSKTPLEDLEQEVIDAHICSHRGVCAVRCGCG